jgi:hypothetical protein
MHKFFFLGQINNKVIPTIQSCIIPIDIINLPEGLSLGGPISHFGVSTADRTATVATTVRSVQSKLRAVTIT